MQKTYIVLYILLLIFGSCTNEHNHNGPVTKLSKAYIESPVSGKKYKHGENLDAVVILRNPEEKIDSLLVLLDDSIIYSTIETKQKYIITINKPDMLLGNHTFSYQLYLNGVKESNKTTLQLVSAKAPEKYTYRVIQTYPHSTDAYTQGLVIYKGVFYEGTGLKGKSALKIIDPLTGNALKTHTLDPQYFGEGITVFNEKIYQLTYQNKTCFVYDLNFKPINSFSYATEGWGLTNNQTELIMSDGSNRLFFINPETFSIIRTIEVYDDKAPRYMLNELEMINGKIWANVYQQNTILIINPDNGMVEAEIDFSGILPDADYTSATDVFNGIAYDSNTGAIYVTGKNWPKLFKIEIIKAI